MSERYWITGAQLGLLISQPECNRKKIVDDIVDKQFICNCWTDDEKAKFKKDMRNYVKSVSCRKKAGARQ